MNIKNTLDKLRHNIAPKVTEFSFSATIHIDDCFERDGEKYFTLSGDLLTKEMIEYDKWLFSQVSEEKGRQRDDEDLILFFYGYHSATVRCRVFFACIEESDERIKDDSTMEVYQSFLEGWNSERCQELYEIEFCNKSSILAIPVTVYFSASPFYTRLAHLKFKKKANMPNTFPNLSGIMTTTSAQLNSQNIPLPSSLDKIVVHNVGQGLCTEIIGTDGNGSAEILYDVGLTMLEKQSQARFKKVRDRLKNVSPKVVIISHLHIDHFIGVKLLDDKVFRNATWIISWTQPSSVSISAGRLAAFLCRKNRNAYFVANLNACQINPTNQLTYELSQGSAKKAGGTSERNNGSLLLKITQKGKDALLTGDCIYTAMPQALWGDYDFLQVPHHGCDLKGYTDVRHFKAKAGGLAVISFGYNTFNHPNFLHSKALIDNGFSVQHTLSDKVEFHF